MFLYFGNVLGFFAYSNILDFAGAHGDVLDFASRLDIAIDVAHAVTYLHMYTGFVYIFWAAFPLHVLIEES